MDEAQPDENVFAIAAEGHQLKVALVIAYRTRVVGCGESAVPGFERNGISRCGGWWRRRRRGRSDNDGRVFAAAREGNHAEREKGDDDEKV